MKKLSTINLACILLLLTACSDSADINVTGVWQGIISSLIEAPTQLQIVDHSGTISGIGNIAGVVGTLEGQRNGAIAHITLDLAGNLTRFEGAFSGTTFSGNYLSPEGELIGAFSLTRQWRFAAAL